MWFFVAGDHGGESATDFFDRVMKETGTTVLWPSKLKIGAKSKKDPQVKVIGFPDAVEKAKELISKDLDTKVQWILVCVDVCACVRACMHACTLAYNKQRDSSIHFPTCMHANKSTR